MSVSVARRTFTVTEYERMASAGILNEDDRVELLEGEIIAMSPIGSLHAACVNRLNSLLTTAVGRAAVVSVQNPIRLTDFSEPEPDVALLRPRSDFYAQSHPTPADALLLIEVADTSLPYDRDTKIPLYARATIPEVWLVDLERETVTQYTRPSGEVYREVNQAGRGRSLASPIIPGLILNVDEILG